MKIFNYEIAFYAGSKHFNMCKKCDKAICTHKTETDTIVCTRIGVLYVSKIKQADEGGRRVPKARP